MTHHLLQLARTIGNPVIEGNRVTFVWKGKTAPFFIDDIHMWEEHPQKMKRIAPDLWVYSLELDSAAYLEYSFYDPRTKKRIKDPLNKQTSFDGYGHYNHYFYMPEAAPTPYAVKRRGVPSASVVQAYRPRSADSRFRSVERSSS